VPSSAFFHERRRDPVYEASVLRVLTENRSHMRLIAASWKSSRDSLSKLSCSGTLVENEVEDLGEGRPFCYDQNGTKGIGLRRQDSDRAALERCRPLPFLQSHSY
jgi:hypothetical protein